MQYIDQMTVEGLGSTAILAYPPDVRATTASTLTLTATSPAQLVLTGTTAGQVVRLPVANVPAIIKGWSLFIWNISTQNVAIQYGDGSVFQTIAPGVILRITLYDNTSANGLWARQSSTIYPASGAIAFSNSFNTATTDYVEHNSTSWFIICSFVFRGTAVFTPTEYQIIGSRPTAGGTALTRLVDYTNGGNVIATLNFTAAAKAVYTASSLANLPVGEAVFEVQVAKSAGGDDKMRVHAVNLK